MTHNLKLHGLRNFRDQCIDLFVITECIGEAAYQLNLLLCAALHGVHNVFYVSLLHYWQNKEVHANGIPIEIDGEAEYKVGEIKGHLVCSGEVQYMMSFTGLDSNEDMWLTKLWLKHAD